MYISGIFSFGDFFRQMIERLFWVRVCAEKEQWYRLTPGIVLFIFYFETDTRGYFAQLCTRVFDILYCYTLAREREREVHWRRCSPQSLQYARLCRLPSLALLTRPSSAFAVLCDISARLSYTYIYKGETLITASSLQFPNAKSTRQSFPLTAQPVNVLRDS